MNEMPLLPSDRYIASLLDLTDEQYRYYMAEVRRRAAQGPQPSVVAGVDFFLYLAVVSQLLSIGFTIAASFFKPRGTGTLTPVQVRGETATNIQRYAPRTGFDGVQDTASLGAPIPLVYAKEEVIDGVKYGGLRVNAMLIWSEMQVRQRSQFLRALFLIGEGSSGFQIDAARVAFGNNPMSPYRYASNSVMDTSAYAKYTLYFKPNGGRIARTDRVLGNLQDPSIVSDNDVFLAPNPSGTPTTSFCQTYKPNSNTQFGLFAPLPNFLGYRLNPVLRPGVTAQITVDAGGGKKSNPKGRIVCDRDNVALAQREKYKARFSGRAGLITPGLGQVSATRVYDPALQIDGGMESVAINVAGLSGLLNKVTVTVDFTKQADPNLGGNPFTYNSEVAFYLASPADPDNGVYLLYDNSGLSGQQAESVRAQLSFSDDHNNVYNASQLTSGNYRPDEALSFFNGIVANGQWLLYCIDNTPGAPLLIHSASITVYT